MLQRPGPARSSRLASPPVFTSQSPSRPTASGVPEVGPSCSGSVWGQLYLNKIFDSEDTGQRPRSDWSPSLGTVTAIPASLAACNVTMTSPTIHVTESCCVHLTSRGRLGHMLNQLGLPARLRVPDRLHCKEKIRPCM